MKNPRILLLVAGSLLLAAAIVAYVVTGSSAPALQPILTKKAATAPQPLVDLSPLQTAKKLASEGVTPEEQALAQQAVHLADQEVDLAFSAAIRNAAEHPSPPSEEQRELKARLKEAEERVKEEQGEVAQLTEQISRARAKSTDALQQELDLAKEQLSLDLDELADAQQDLARSGGDVKTVIQRMLDAHEAAMHQGGGAPSAAAAVSHPETQATFSLVSRIRAWKELHAKHLQLLAAQQEARSAAAGFSTSHDALEREVAQESAHKTELAHRAKSLLHGTGEEAADPQQAAAAALAAVKHLKEDQQALAEFDKRIEAEQSLASVYENWIAQILARERAALHQTLESAVWILLIVLLVLVGLQVIDRFFRKLAHERKRLWTLRSVLKFGAQALGVILILLVILGPPNQFATVLALAGAGLTVALKDFIVGFFGWFVLMGKNGIRVGDWVEINGVSGEVVEIGLFRTVLLETGSWSDASHPTGRKVTFTNSFAIEGHFFNFSTSGQWLWDDLEVVLPTGEPAYAMAEAIQTIVTSETETNSRLAEQEWERMTSDYAPRSFSAAPAVSVRPSNLGINVKVRYLTRANERHEVRSRLYRAVVDLLQKKKLQGAARRFKESEWEEGEVPDAKP